MIKSNWLAFPKYETCSVLLKDFLALIEEKSDTRRGGDLYLIHRNPVLADDFVHSVNLACIGTFHSQNKYPDIIKEIDKLAPTQAQMEFLSPESVTLKDWNKSSEESSKTPPEIIY